MINFVEIISKKKIIKRINRDDTRNKLIENFIREYYPNKYKNPLIDHSVYCLKKLAGTGIVPKVLKYDDNSITLSYCGEQVKEPDLNKVNKLAKVLNQNGVKHCDLHNENILEKDGKYYAIDFTLAQANGIVGLADLFHHEVPELIRAKLTDYRFQSLDEIKQDLYNWLPQKTAGEIGSHEYKEQIYMDMKHILDFELPYQRSYIEWRLKKILEFLPRNLTGIDFGCSNGVMCFDLARHGYRMTGIDYDKESIDFALNIEDFKRYRVNFRWQDLDFDFVNDFLVYPYDFAVCLSMFQWVIAFQGMEKAKKIIRAISEKIPILVFDVAQGKEKQSKAYHFKNVKYIRDFLRLNTVYNEIFDLGCEPNTEWQKRNLFICRRRG